MTADRSLEVATRIGSRIVSTAHWTGDRCTWTIRVPDRSGGRIRQAKRELAGGGLYNGTAGIALFLAELSRFTDDAKVGSAAVAGMEHAFDRISSVDRGLSFHSGPIGVIYAASQAGALLSTDRWRTRCREVLEQAQYHPLGAEGADLIGGSAGTLVALLALLGVFDDDLIMPLALRLGDQLISVAHREPHGWSWAGALQGTQVRNLTGLAHGASGVGYPLLELWAVTGEGRFRYAAEQAYVYERQFFDQSLGNWPDFRDLELAAVLSEGGVRRLTNEVRAGNFRERPPLRYSCAWCHGAPGIGLARLRAFELLGTEIYRDEAEAACEATSRTLAMPGHGAGFSLCHGHAGNAATLLYASEVLDRPRYRQVVEERAELGWQLFEKAGRPWPCGTMGGVADPSLMLGEAGIGQFYLGLHVADTVPVLFPVPPRSRIVGAAATPVDGGVRDSYVESFFQNTLRCCARVGLAVAPLPSAGREAPAPDAKLAYEAITEAIGGAGDRGEGIELRRVFAVERARFEMTLEIEDFREGLIRSALRKEAPPVDLRSGLLQSRPLVRVVRGEMDGPAYYLLYRSGNDVAVRPIGVFVAHLMEMLREPTSFAEVVRAIRGAAPAKGVESRNVAGIVEEQLQQLYAADLVELRQRGSM